MGQANPGGDPLEERRQNEELGARRRSLADERARYADLFEFAPFACFITDTDGTIVEANNRAGELLNVRRQLLIGKPLVTYVAPDDRRLLRRILLEVGRGAEEPHEWAMQIKPRGLRPMHAGAIVRRSRAAAGELHWILHNEERPRHRRETRGLNIPLNTRVAEKAAELFTERAHLAAIVEQMPSAVIIVDARSGEILLANGVASTLLGSPVHSHWLSSEWREFDLQYPDGPSVEQQNWPITRSMQRGEIVIGEVFRLIRPDKTAALVEVSSSPIRNEQGEIAAGLALLTDVTAREHRERVERDFITNAAHELQTPLAGIISAVEVLQSGAKEDPLERERFLAHVERECGRLTRLVRALLVLAQAQMGSAAPRSELLELAPLLEEVAVGVYPSSDVVVQVDCAPDLALLTNRELVVQLLSNLGANAAKFTRRGSIVFRAQQVGEGTVTIGVEDTGPGIPAGAKERVFERFYRSANTAGDGFGLGLAIVRAAVSALEGSLDISTTPGFGTTVTVTLPGARLVRR